jgi:hypothetical protein
MRSFIVILVVLIGFMGCVKKNKVPTAQTGANPDTHQVNVVEVIQTSQYTYMKVSENGSDNWIAVTRMEAAAGETYYYGQALEMKNFQSKELKRTFETIYFVQDISKQPIVAGAMNQPAPPDMMGSAAAHTGKIPDAQQPGISVTPVDGISIAKLFANKKDYAGKKIRMKGQVVKINEEVMGKNWIHIQDGTKDGDNFDLTVTTLDGVKLNDVVTFEGTIGLDKDFTHGYFYAVIMEDATLLK